MNTTTRYMVETGPQQYCPGNCQISDALIMSLDVATAWQQLLAICNPQARIVTVKCEVME